MLFSCDVVVFLLFKLNSVKTQQAHCIICHQDIVWLSYYVALPYGEIVAAQKAESELGPAESAKTNVPCLFV